MGEPVTTLCREAGIGSGTSYKWRSKYGGKDASLVTRIKELEEQNRRLMKMDVEAQLKADIIKEALAKKRHGHPASGRWPDGRLRRKG